MTTAARRAPLLFAVAAAALVLDQLSKAWVVATLEGRPPIPWGMLLLTLLGYAACVVPGVILHLMVLRKMYRFYSLVVTANPVSEGTEVSISYPDFARDLVPRFLAALPPLVVEAASYLGIDSGEPREQP